MIDIPFPDFLENVENHRLPVYVSGWFEDIHDPHNWVMAFFGIYAGPQQLPEEMIVAFAESIDAGVTTTDPAEREAIYRELQQLDYDNAIAIRGAVPTGRKYMQRWVNGWYYNPIAPGEFFYALSID